MIIDPAGLDRRRRNVLINGLVSPRPVAWVSSVSADGARNLAPFSFFGAFSFDPPTIGIGPGSRQGEPKDTLRNVETTGEMVVNLVDRALAEAANACSGEWGSEVDEWEVVAAAGVTPTESETVRPPRVEQAPAALECSVLEVLELGTAERRSNGLVVARINRIHVADRAIRDLVPDAGELDLVARMGGDEWCTTRDRFLLPRPSVHEPAAAAAEMLTQLSVSQTSP